MTSTDKDKKKRLEKLEKKTRAHIRGDRQIKSRTRELWRKAVIEERSKDSIT